MSVRHPTTRSDGERARFERFAEAASNFTSSPTFFAICVALIAAWALSSALGAAADLKDLLGYGMAALSLIVLALLKNSERRAEHAIQQKLDAIASALLRAREGEPDAGKDELREAVGMHDEV